MIVFLYILKMMTLVSATLSTSLTEVGLKLMNQQARLHDPYQTKVGLQAPIHKG